MIQRHRDKSCLFCYRKAICHFPSISSTFENIKVEKKRTLREQFDDHRCSSMNSVSMMLGLFSLVKDLAVPPMLVSNFSSPKKYCAFIRFWILSREEVLFLYSLHIKFPYFWRRQKNKKGKEMLEAIRMSWGCNRNVFMYILNYCLNSQLIPSLMSRNISSSLKN